MNSKVVQWIMGIAATLLTGLAGSVWYDQRDVVRALNANTTAISILAVELKGYIKVSEDRVERVEREQEAIVERLNRGGIKP